jgi:hypothetical protein
MVGGLCDSDPFASDGFCYPESQKNEANRHRIVAVRSAWPSYWVESLLVRLGGAWCSVMTRVRVKLHLPPPVRISRLSTQPYDNLSSIIESRKAQPNRRRSVAEQSIWHGTSVYNAYGGSPASPALKCTWY